MSDQLTQYGPWAVAFGFVLFTLKEVILQMMRPISKNGDPPAALLELARAVEKLTSVLDRMERFQDRALTDLLNTQREIMRMLTEIRSHQEVDRKHGGGT